jgi:dTDP-4-amino-4,6-dideoxygalactose transaminase
VIPVLDLKAQYNSIRGEIDDAVTAVLETADFVLGPRVRQFEERLAAYCECSHGVGVASGTDALRLALVAAGVGPGDEVITSPFSFIATASSISHCGATPIFVDVEPDTLNIDAAQVADAVTDRTRAIVPVHLFGHPADLDRLLSLARERGLVVIEDAAQAVGARYNDRRVGGFGLAGCFSFYPTKNLGAYGDGGMVVTNNSGFSDAIDVLRRQGSMTKYHAEVLGFNSRLDALQAAVLSAKLEHLDAWNEKRRVVAQTYNLLLADLPVQLPIERSYAYHVYHQYTIQADRRDELATYLKGEGIGSMIYYPVPLHKQAVYSGLKVRPLPVSETAARRVLSLPMYPELTQPQQCKIAAAIAGFLSQS